MARLQGARVVVTGAAGFVGAHLLDAFAREGAEVSGLVRPQTDRWRLAPPTPAAIVPCDLEDEEATTAAFTRLAPDLVVHAAVARPPKGNDWHEHFARQNLALSWNVACATRRVRAQRLVWLTTQYEHASSAAAAAEDDLGPPDNFYGAVKHAASAVVRRYAAEVGLPWCGLRLFSVYGPLESPSRFIQVALRAGLRGERVPLTADDPVHDFVYIDDVVRGVVLAATHAAAPGEIFNIATGVGTSNRAVLRAIEDLVGSRIDATPGAFPASERDRAHWRADTAKSADRLGFRAAIPLREGLARNLAWLRSRQGP